MDKGELVYEYNMMMIERYIGRSAATIGAGKHRIVVDTSIGKPGGHADVAITIDDQETMRVAIKRTVAGAFSASETLDVGSGPRLASLIRLFRPPALRVQWQNRRCHNRPQVIDGAANEGSSAARSANDKTLQRRSFPKACQNQEG